MFNKDLMIKEVGAQFMNMVAASEEKAKGLMNELIKHREEVENKRDEKQEIVKQLLLLDMMKSDLLIKLSSVNKELNNAKEEMKDEEKRLKQQQVHKIYPEMFMKGCFEYDKEIDKIDGSNYREE